jgi:hypothetical protein
MARPKAINPAGVIEELKRKIASLQEQWRGTRRENQRLPPNTTNGGRAARSSESACHNAAALIANIIGVTPAAERAMFRVRPVIHEFASTPVRDRNRAKIGMRTRPSDAASSEFFTRKRQDRSCRSAQRPHAAATLRAPRMPA